MREVYGEFRDSQDQPLVGLEIVFRRIGLAVQDGTIYVEDSVSVKTGEAGTFSIDLLETTESELETFWQCTIPGTKIFQFSLEPSTAAVNLAALRVHGVDANTVQSIKDLVAAIEQDLNDHIAQTAAHGTSSPIVGVNDAQTLNNKTIDQGTF